MSGKALIVQLGCENGNRKVRRQTDRPFTNLNFESVMKSAQTRPAFRPALRKPTDTNLGLAGNHSGGIMPAFLAEAGAKKIAGAMPALGLPDGCDWSLLPGKVRGGACYKNRAYKQKFYTSVLRLSNDYVVRIFSSRRRVRERRELDCAARRPSHHDSLLARA